MGNGYSIAHAMAVGLPVLTLPGSDGADKAGPYTQPDLPSYLESLVRLSGQRAARAELGKRQRDRFREVFDLDAGGGELVAALESAIRRRGDLRG